MSKESRAFYAMLRDEGSGAEPQTAREAALNAREFFGEIWDAAKPMFDHGRTEAAAAIFSGHGHVLYMHNDRAVEEPMHVPSQEPQQEQDRGGREM